METRTLKIEHRAQHGTKYTRTLRRTGRLPGIIYGHGEAPLSFSIDRHELVMELLHGQRLLSLDLDGQPQSYLIKEVQMNHLGNEPIHLDLTRVDLTERVKVAVALVLKGIPKGAADGGVLDQQLNELQVECLVLAIPEDIRVSVTGLGVDDVLYVRDLAAPEGVKILNDPEAIVAAVRVVAEDTTPAVGTPEATSTEPEIIAKGKIEEEGAEAKE
ncbi:MAG: General stress protein CTC [Phycisphaerae bacterium]|nr:General stress protein CTC [Phycisphaerae bacterium]